VKARSDVFRHVRGLGSNAVCVLHTRFVCIQRFHHVAHAC